MLPGFMPHLNLPTPKREGVLDANTSLGQLSVKAFLGRGQLSALWLFGGLKRHDVGWFVALEACIFPQLAAGGKDNLLRVGQGFVVLFTGHSGTEHLDF